MLTTLDKVLLFLLVVVSILSAGAVGWLVFVLADPLLPSDLERMGDRQNVSLTGGLLFVVGMALAYALVLTVCGALSRRFASATTHQRWAEFLDPDSMGARRYPGMINLLRVALIPKEFRT